MTLDNLYWLSQNSNNWDKYYELASDIDASSTATWDDGDGADPEGLSPIGNASVAFTGSFDGKGYKIDGLRVTRGSQTYAGLFGYVSGGEIKSVRALNADIRGSEKVGVLVGYMSSGSKVDGVVVEGRVVGTNTSAGQAGGLVGFSNGSEIVDCQANVEVSALGYYVGGLVGYNNSSSVIRDSHSSGDVTSTSYSVGGLVGCNSSEIRDSYSSGNVTSTSYNVGGLVGYNGYNSSVSNCYSIGSVTSSGYYYDYVGGLIGSNYESTITNSFWDIELSGVSTSAGGTGKTSAEMTTQSTYTGAGWDFTTPVWAMDVSKNYGYPYLNWQTVFPEDVMPTLSSPANNEMDVSVSPTLSWQSFNSANSYELQVSTTANFSENLQIYSNLTETSYSLKGLVQGSYYYWRVRAKSASDSSQYSLVWRFKTIKYGGGEGAEENPYKISTLSDLQLLQNTSEDWDKYFQQTADIDASATSDWDNGKGFSPIGNNTTSFTGVYDGGGYIIDGLYINRPTAYLIGLFGKLGDYNDSAKIKNLGVTNVEMLGGQTTDYNTNFVGGLVADNEYSTITNCFATGNLTYLGGNGGANLGGLIGYSRNSSVTNSYSMCNITGKDATAGGLIGRNYESTVENSFSISSVYVNSDHDNAGGFIGDNENNSSVSNCYSMGSVTSSGDFVDIGGFIGRNNRSSVSNSYSISSVSAGEYSDKGGLIGSDYESTITNSFWDIELSGLSASAGGTGKTSAELKTQSTYISAGWDFAAPVWAIESSKNYGYPYLSWQTVFSPALLTPSLSSPTNTSENVSLAPTLSWLEVSNASSYEVQLATNANLTENLQTFKNITTTTHEVTSLTKNTTYYWRVRALNSTDTSSYTLVWQFETQEFSGGDGSSGDPYQISELEDLRNMQITPEEWDKYFIQTADIDASETSGWDEGKGFSPIGNDTVTFTGTYDGGRKTISGLTINRPSIDYIGYFGVTDGAVIKNLGLNNISISGKSSVGGLVGRNINSSNIINCYASGNVAGNGEISYVGGLVGLNVRATISESYSSGSITSSGDDIGGLIGMNMSSGLVTNCYSLSAVAGGGDNTGGLVGENNNATISYSYSVGSVSGSGSNVGGFIGKNGDNGSVSNSFWNTETSGQSSSAEGVGKTTEEMQSQAVYTDAGWDFSTPVWKQGAENNGEYPYLSWQTEFGQPPLEIPMLVSPGNEASGISLTAVLTWQQVVNAEKYDVQLATNDGFTEGLQTYSDIVNVTTQLSGLSESTVYYWRVRAKRMGDTTDYSQPWSFTTIGAGELATPTLVAPTHEATDVPVSTTLSWNAISSVTSYDVELATDEVFDQNKQTFADITSTSHSVNSLSEGITYYWRVKAKNGAITSAFSDVYSFTTTFSVEVNVAARTVTFVPSNPSKESSIDYRMISLPCNLANVKVNGTAKSPLRVSDIIITGDQGSDWALYRDNGQTTNYKVSLSKGIALTKTGEGFWLVKSGGLSMPTLSSEIVLDQDHCATLTVNPNTWNIIGNPYTENVLWQSIQDQNGLSGKIWSYNGSGFDASSTMEPYKGYYYMETQGSSQLKIPNPNGIASTQALAKRSLYSTFSEEGNWQVRIQLSSERNQDKQNVVGVHPKASQGLDVYDDYKPPMFKDQAYLVFKRPEWNSRHSSFSSDIRPVFSKGQIWEFVVINPIGGKTSLELVPENVPDGYRVVLKDSLNANPFEIKDRSTYSYVSQVKKQAFKMLVGTDGFIEESLEKLKPEEYALMQNYPNPFNPETVIGFKLKEQGKVNLIIYNVLGQKVKTLVSEQLKAGTHNVVWDGTNNSGVKVSSGVYFYRLMTKGTRIGVKKMTLLK